MSGEKSSESRLLCAWPWRKVHVQYNSLVERVEVEGDHAPGVVLQDSSQPGADVIVANADLPYVFSQLPPRGAQASRLGVDRVCPQPDAHLDSWWTIIVPVSTCPTQGRLKEGSFSLRNRWVGAGAYRGGFADQVGCSILKRSSVMPARMMHTALPAGSSSHSSFFPWN